MQINPTKNGFAAIFTENDLNEQDLEFDGFLDTSPDDPRMMALLSKAVTTALQKNITTPAKLGLFEVIPYTDEKTRRILLDFKEACVVNDEDMKESIDHEVEEICSKLFATDELNPEKNDIYSPEYKKRLLAAARQAYMDNHPEAAVTAEAEAGHDVCITIKADRLDNITELAKTLPDANSRVYKHNDTYYLVLDLSAEFINANPLVTDIINNAVTEHGLTEIINKGFGSFLAEHGEAIIKSNAIAVSKML